MKTASRPDLSFAPTSGALPPRLSGLLALVAAILVWYGWVEVSDQLEATAASAATLHKLERRGVVSAREDLAQARRYASQQRQGLERRLRSVRTEQMLRAEAFYEFRQKCQEVQMTCLIKLITPVDGSAAGEAGSTVPESEPLEELNIRRIRVLVSGNLGKSDIQGLLDLVRKDPHKQWRVNELKVKRSVFELDVEQHVMASPSR